MIFDAFVHREARLHGAQVMSGLDLSGGQGYSGAMIDAMESDVPSADRDVLQAVHQERAPSVHRHGGIVGRHLEVLQLHRQG
jgi:hypothetical protein